MKQNKKLFFFMCAFSTILMFVSIYQLPEEKGQPPVQIMNVFVCSKYLGEHCREARIFARLVYPTQTIKEYSGQNTTHEDILIVVCGCSHASSFNGIIVYADNGYGQMYLPEVRKRNVIYLGVQSASPKHVILRHIPFFFVAVSTADNTKVQHQLYTDHRLLPELSRTRRSFLVYFQTYCTAFNEYAYNKFTSFTRKNKLPLPDAVGRCYGNYPGTINVKITPKNKTITPKKTNLQTVFSDFRYSLILEKRNSSGFVSKSITDAFIAGTIPIYYGTKDVFKLFNRNAFIYFDVNSPQTTFDLIKKLETNETVYNYMINQPILADGRNTLEEFFSITDSIGFGKLKSRILCTIRTTKIAGNLDTSDQSLQSLSRINHEPVPFYMYTDNDMTMNNWSKICYDYGTTDMTLLNLFKKHPWRTTVASDAEGLFNKRWESTKRSLIVPYIVPPGLDIITPDFSDWKNRKYYVWYHTRTIPSSYGATKLRYLPVEKEHLFPGHVGFDIPRNKWINGWKNSKFCLVIRGDTPSSHAFYNAIASGCIPVIISDTYELVALPFKNILQLKSIAVVIPENVLLKMPEKVMSTLNNISENHIVEKLLYIREIQPILLINHPRTIFPDLLLHETSKIIDKLLSKL